MITKEQEKKEIRNFVLIMAAIFIMSCIGDGLEYYDKFSSAEYKCEQNRMSGWPNPENKRLCDKWLPIIKDIKVLMK